MCVVNKTFTRSTTAASTHSIYSHSNTAVWINPLPYTTLLFHFLWLPCLFRQHPLDKFISQSYKACILDEHLANTDTHIPGFTRVTLLHNESWLTQPLKCKSIKKNNQHCPYNFSHAFYSYTFILNYNTLE